MRVGLLFFGLHRFANLTKSNLLRILPSGWELKVYSHSWKSSDGVHAPWVKAHDLEVASDEEFRALWPSVNAVEEAFTQSEPPCVASSDPHFANFSGYESRRSVFRMMCSISMVCEMALHDEGNDCSRFVMTRTDFLCFLGLPEPLSSNPPVGVFFPNLRRNNGFCDWFLVFDKNALRVLSRLRYSFEALVMETMSFAGEELLLRALENGGCKVKSFEWRGILVRDSELADSRFGKLPMTKEFFRKRTAELFRSRVSNILDSIAGKIQSINSLQGSTRKKIRSSP